jgi:hypothetical protein
MPDVPLLLVDGSNVLFRAWFCALLRTAVRDEIPLTRDNRLVSTASWAARRGANPTPATRPTASAAGPRWPGQGASRREARSALPHTRSPVVSEACRRRLRDLPSAPPWKLTGAEGRVRCWWRADGG